MIRIYIRKQILLIGFALSFFVAGAQKFTYITSPVPLKEKKLVYANVVGEIEDRVFVKSIKGGLFDRDLRISVYDKHTAALIKTMALMGFGNKKPDKTILDADFNKIIINNNLVYVVWENYIDGDAQLILQIFDKDLKEIQNPRVIYQLMNVRKSHFGNKLFFYMSKNGEKMIVGCEQKLPKSEFRSLNYNVIDKYLSVKCTVNTQLPFSLFAASNIQMDDDGFLYFINCPNIFERTSNWMSITTENAIWSINPGNSKSTKKVFFFEDKSIHSILFEMFEDHILVIGTYSLEKEKKERGQKDSVGIFTSKLNKYSYKSIGEVKFSGIGEEKMVYADYAMKKRDSIEFSNKAFALKQMKKYDFFLSNCMKTEENGVLLMINTQQVYANFQEGNRSSGSRTSASMHTGLIGVNYIKIDAKGDIEWVSCIEQGVDYPTVSIPVINLLKRGNNLYTLIPSNNSKINACMIDLTNGIGGKSTFKKQFNVQGVDFCNNDFYFVGLKHHDVYFGRYELQ